MIVVIATPIALNSLSLNVRDMLEDRLHCYLALLTHVSKHFRNIEIGLGTFKIAVALVIILAMNVINSSMP